MKMLCEKNLKIYIIIKFMQIIHSSLELSSKVYGARKFYQYPGEPENKYENKIPCQSYLEHENLSRYF